MAAIFLAQNELARRQQDRQRLSVYDIPEDTFRRNYRLGFNDFRFLCDLIRNDDVFQRSRENALTVELQMATTLRFLASGSFQNVAGDVAGICQSSQSRSIAAVTDSISARAGDFINFWRHGSSASKKASFAEMAQMPNTLGCIDCTHIAIRAPKENEHLYVNRKGRHSINMQAIRCI
nr:putative nuclease HARBI1 [Lytechinus pictus]